LVQPIYLDNNATIPVDRRVAESMSEALRAGWANPSSQHRFGQAARGRLDSLRSRIGQLVGARGDARPADRVILTSGGTESNNLAILGLCGSPPGSIIVSAIEHPSITAAAEVARARGFCVHRLPVSEDGRWQVDDLAALIDSTTRLVSLVSVNHETGVIQPTARAAAICREHDVLCHTDAVQGVGKAALRFDELGVDAMTFTAHKLGGPKGIGALVVRGGIALEPILFGGSQQGGLRPGTEDVVLAEGFAAALELWDREGPAWSATMGSLRDRFERRVASAVDGVVIIGQTAQRASGTSLIAFRGLDRQALMMALDQAGVAVSSGAACSSGSTDVSPVLRAMGLDHDTMRGAIRISLGPQTTVTDIDQAADIVAATANEMYHRAREPLHRGSRGHGAAATPERM